jgi:hypothetical protein
VNDLHAASVACYDDASETPRARTREPVPRLALSPDEAAAALAVSRETFDKRILPNLRVVRLGRRIIVSVPELERWLRENASLPVGEER